MVLFCLFVLLDLLFFSDFNADVVQLNAQLFSLIFLRKACVWNLQHTTHDGRLRRQMSPHSLNAAISADTAPKLHFAGLLIFMFAHVYFVPRNVFCSQCFANVYQDSLSAVVFHSAPYCSKYVSFVDLVLFASSMLDTTLVLSLIVSYQRIAFWPTSAPSIYEFLNLQRSLCNLKSLKWTQQQESFVNTLVSLLLLRKANSIKYEYQHQRRWRFKEAEALTTNKQGNRRVRSGSSSAAER